MKSNINFSIFIIFITIIYNSCKENTPNNKVESFALAAPIPLQTLPQDVLDSCSVDAASFANWFADGKVTANGFVNPANSVAFSPIDNCSFYTWSEQMFLWLTSSGSKYGGGNSVLESPVFYVSSPESSDGTRQLIKYKKGNLLNASVDINKIETEEGQAGTNSVLLDRHGNVVYYITFVNDVYVALLNMAAQNGTSVTQFPTTDTALQRILTFAKANKIDIKEPNALAMELKTSWVKLEGDMKKEDFITIVADIPTYDKKNDSLWVLTGETQDTLALVGMHVVGSAAGHPEMIWSTFEHKYNTPNAMYQYVNNKGVTVNVAPDSDGYWLFNTNPKDTSMANANVQKAAFSNNSIIGFNNNPIKPSNTIRILPWGSSYNLKPNQQDLNSAYANSEVIALNNSVINKLTQGDVRKNYLFIGSTWTFKGAVPNGTSYPQDTVLSQGAAIGTSNLANSTMETNAQGSSPFVLGTTCFSCHTGTLDPKVDNGLSHIFHPLMNGLKPKGQFRKKSK